MVLHSEHGEYHQHDVLTVSRTAKRVVAAPAVVDELEVAVEARADTPTNSENSSAPLTTASYMSTIRNNRDLAVITFHINDLELIQQSVDSSSSLRLQAGHISCNECVSISREEFQVTIFIIICSSNWKQKIQLLLITLFFSQNSTHVVVAGGKCRLDMGKKILQGLTIRPYRPYEFAWSKRWIFIQNESILAAP